ncbi:MAG: prepilin peptidase [Coriobacteriia bacterium]|nr:prepilin peptidase [Coriobacteriia bacterium]
MLNVPHWFFLLALGGFGLLFGSFANVVIWRFPRGESLASPPSHCPCCQAPIAWYDNVPVLSWVLLKGHCRSCGESISVRYPAVEMLSGVLWLLAGVVFGMTIQTAFAVALFYLLLILTFIDIDHQRLPNAIIGLLGAVGVIGVALSQATELNVLPLAASGGEGLLTSPFGTAILGIILGGGVSLAISAAYGAVRGKTGLGMGDVKLLAVLGLFLGPYVLMTLMIGSIVGAIYGVIAGKHAESLASVRIPFGPFLAAGAVVAATVGPAIWNSYARLVGLS